MSNLRVRILLPTLLMLLFYSSGSGSSIGGGGHITLHQHRHNHQQRQQQQQQHITHANRRQTSTFAGRQQHTPQHGNYIADDDGDADAYDNDVQKLRSQTATATANPKRQHPHGYVQQQLLQHRQHKQQQHKRRPIHLPTEFSGDIMRVSLYGKKRRPSQKAVIDDLVGDYYDGYDDNDGGDDDDDDDDVDVESDSADSDNYDDKDDVDVAAVDYRRHYSNNFKAQQSKKGRSTRQTVNAIYDNDENDTETLLSGRITAQKINEVGTPERAHNAFAANLYNEQKLQELDRMEEAKVTQDLNMRIDPKRLQELAKKHKRRIETEAECALPRPQLEYMYHNRVRYQPRATILHRCSNTTACCDNNKLCVAKEWEHVYLAFEEISAQSTNYVMRRFVNHTKCHCVSRNKRSLSSAAAAVLAGTVSDDDDDDCECPSHFVSVPPIDIVGLRSKQRYSGSDGDSVDASSSQCRCDCARSNQSCQRLKEGTRTFATVDRNCILRNECTLPTCSHGHYNYNTGRCPPRAQRNNDFD